MLVVIAIIQRACFFQQWWQSWLRSTFGRTPVFGWWIDPVLRSACSWQV